MVSLADKSAGMASSAVGAGSKKVASGVTRSIESRCAALPRSNSRALDAEIVSQSASDGVLDGSGLEGLGGVGISVGSHGRGGGEFMEGAQRGAMVLVGMTAWVGKVMASGC